MRRRSFLKGLLGAAALIAAPGVPEILVPERKIWALDRTMAATVAELREHAALTGRLMGLATAEAIDDDLERMFAGFSTSIGKPGTTLTWEHLQAAKQLLVQTQYYDFDEHHDSWGRTMIFDPVLPTT